MMKSVGDRAATFFKSEIYIQNKDLYQSLSTKQTPGCLFITCSDSRIDPNLITQSKPGSMFIYRNIGNMLPRDTSKTSEASAAIQYAVDILKVSEIIICGHSDCGAMKAVLHPEETRPLNHIHSWIAHSREEIQSKLKDRMSAHESSKKRLSAAVKLNVLLQVERMKSLDIVKEKLQKAELKIHAWVYDIETGKFLAHNSITNQFSPLGKPMPYVDKNYEHDLIPCRL